MRSSVPRSPVAAMWVLRLIVLVKVLQCAFSVLSCAVPCLPYRQVPGHRRSEGVRHSDGGRSLLRSPRAPAAPIVEEVGILGTTCVEAIGTVPAPRPGRKYLRPPVIPEEHQP